MVGRNKLDTQIMQKDVLLRTATRQLWEEEYLLSQQGVRR